ncbi:Golgin-84 family protein [Dictyocaulus viviparus]|uniref:Golgin-84 family protein n=1 Tax=Dictyocaulus viviparus TaxID=29172 RepID=A0A0D8XLL8_DICVI|nr:Golgin-84 family protein [Dictyocaulus viviparus]
MAMLNEDVGNDSEEIRSRRSSGRSVVSVQTARSFASELPQDNSQIKSQLWAKESQIAAMRTRILELERKLTKRSDEFYELKAEKEIIEQRLAQQSSRDSVEELKLARRKAQEQQDILIEECAQLRRKYIAQEEEVRAMGEQLRLAKFNLSENKKEFDQYKEKAQKILQAKEKLVDSLKGEQNTGESMDRPGHLLQAELEEIKVERDLARADLESAQLMVYNLRSEIDEMENQLREEQVKQSEQRKQYLEEKQSWQATVTLLSEKVDCARIEGEFVKQEMKRQSEDFVKKLELQEVEMRKNVENQRTRRREEELNRGSDGLSIGDRLLQKQGELEDALRKNQILSLRLERLQKCSRETVIPIDPPSVSLPIHSSKNAMTSVDSVILRAVLMLRNYPAARLFLAIYFILIHFWVFFIVLTYTPEIHDNFGGNGNNVASA